MRQPCPARCTTAPLSAGPPPMKAHTPTTPSLPTTATSVAAPFSIDETSETVALAGK